jgi:cellulose synthase/poly-beta-1,6-N-acetylglucosamine synthase-like glycosyltransferase
MMDLPGYLKFLNDKKIASQAWPEKSYYQSEIHRLKKFIGQKKTIGDYRNIYHLVLIPFVDESFEVLDSTFAALVQANYPKDRVMVILASEERVG